MLLLLVVLPADCWFYLLLLSSTESNEAVELLFSVSRVLVLLADSNGCMVAELFRIWALFSNRVRTTGTTLEDSTQRWLVPPDSFRGACT